MTIKGLRAFLNLMGYYHKFIQNYGLIVRTLSQMLMKEAFGWESAADQAFDALK
jgi:hypothetical protein